MSEQPRVIWQQDNVGGHCVRVVLDQTHSASGLRWIERRVGYDRMGAEKWKTCGGDGNEADAEDMRVLRALAWDFVYELPLAPDASVPSSPPASGEDPATP